MRAIYMGLLTHFLIFMHVAFFWVVPMIIGARLLLKARKNKENRRLIIGGYIIVYLAVLFWIISSISFAFDIIIKSLS